MIKTKNRRAVTSISVVAIAALMIASVAAYDFAYAKPGGGGGGGEPKASNKTMMGESYVDVVLDTYKWKTIIGGWMKTSTTSDLVITHFQECAIHTGLKLDAFNERLTSVVREDVRLLIDGNVIPASYGEDPTKVDEYGIVTMCARAFHISTNALSNIDALCELNNLNNPLGTQCTLPASFFDSYIRTKQTHGWQWIALDVGSGDHLIEVQARTYTALDGMESGSDAAQDWASNTESCMKDNMEVPGYVCVDSILEVGKKSLIAVEDKLVVGTTYK